MNRNTMAQIAGIAGGAAVGTAVYLYTIAARRAKG